MSAFYIFYDNFNNNSLIKSQWHSSSLSYLPLQVFIFELNTWLFLNVFLQERQSSRKPDTDKSLTLCVLQHLVIEFKKSLVCLTSTYLRISNSGDILISSITLEVVNSMLKKWDDIKRKKSGWLVYATCCGNVNLFKNICIYYWHRSYLRLWCQASFFLTHFLRLDDQPIWSFGSGFGMGTSKILSLKKRRNSRKKARNLE